MKLRWTLGVLSDLSRGLLTELATRVAGRLGYELAPVARVAAYREEMRLDLEDAAEDVAKYYGALLTIARGPCGCLVRDPCDACLAAGVIEWNPEAEEAPYVCPGCHAVGEERCAPGCIDAEIEAENRNRELCGTDDEEVA